MASRKSKLAISGNENSNETPKMWQRRASKTQEIPIVDDGIRNEYLERRTAAEDSIAEYLNMCNTPEYFKSMTSNFRVASWGQTLPLYKDQEKLQRLIRKCLVNERAEKLDLNKWRSQLVLGTWKLGDKLTFDIGMMEPTIYTSVMDATFLTQEEMNFARSRINVIHEGSGSNKRVSRSVKYGKYRASGRLASSLVNVLDQVRDETVRTSMSFAGMGATALVCLVNFDGNMAACMFTVRTLYVLARSLHHSCSPSFFKDMLKIQAWGETDKNSSYIRIDPHGGFVINSTPQKANVLLDIFKTGITTMVSDVDSCRQFISSLQVVEQF